MMCFFFSSAVLADVGSPEPRAARCREASGVGVGWVVLDDGTWVDVLPLGINVLIAILEAVFTLWTRSEGKERFSREENDRSISTYLADFRKWLRHSFAQNVHHRSMDRIQPRLALSRRNQNVCFSESFPRRIGQHSHTGSFLADEELLFITS